MLQTRWFILYIKKTKEEIHLLYYFVRLTASANGGGKYMTSDQGSSESRCISLIDKMTAVN